MFERVNVQNVKEDLERRLRGKEHEKNILEMNIATLSARVLRLECQLEDVKEQRIRWSRHTRRMLKVMFE